MPTRKERPPSSPNASDIALAFVHPWLSDALYVAVALMWLVPDRRIEGAMGSENLQE